MEKLIPVSLPGGLLLDGKRYCTAFMRPIDGWIEERMGTVTEDVANLPEAVSGILGEALDSIAGLPGDSGLAASLCIADRQWLMLALGRQIRGGGHWLQAKCDSCNNSFDLYLDPAHLPVKPGGEGFPYAQVDAAGESILLRLPTGADQERIVDVSPDEALTVLLSSCIIGLNDGPAPDGYAESLNGETLELIEDALDAVSPYVGDTLSTNCPECRRDVLVEINPYLLHAGSYEDLFQEVHILASHYHWTEEAILSLPRSRRRLYLRLIERERHSSK
ncbi:MAG: hypothetical protein HGA78_11300 [Nitrospirales bacterium]|nr:hypothetical protein [Nitrospirales bacterium]